jgi:hypothetical protein
MKKPTIHRATRSIIAVFAICCIAYSLYAQETTLELPTNDNTSSFNVTKNNGTSVFKVDGTGRITGDGSGLSNTKPLINYIKGNQWVMINSNHGSYDNVRTVTLTVPGPGIVWAQASGTARWESKGWDLLLCSILMDADPNDSWSAEDEWYSNLKILTDYNCADSSDQYTGFTVQNFFYVNAGTHTFTLWANKYSSSARTSVMDVSLVAMFIPTGGTGKAVLREEEYKVKPGPGVHTPDF